MYLYIRHSTKSQGDSNHVVVPNVSFKLKYEFHIVLCEAITATILSGESCVISYLMVDNCPIICFSSLMESEEWRRECDSRCRLSMHFVRITGSRFAKVSLANSLLFPHRKGSVVGGEGGGGSSVMQSNFFLIKKSRVAASKRRLDRSFRHPSRGPSSFFKC
jgi:hypothetical protein